MRIKHCLLAALAVTLALPALALPQTPSHTFVAGERDFLLDGKPFQIIAGEMHFSRIPREYWRHRLKMARAMGLNTIATYVFWNYHEPEPGKFDFASENRDIASFIRMAQEEGLFVTVRPGPYACAEWEFGGYPWWLLKEKGLLIRSMDERFLKACERYLNRLGLEIAPLQVTRGGPILMVQVENEYGSYGKDKEFMGAMRDMILKAGFEVPLNTADGPSQCRNGSISGVLPALDGEYNPGAVRDTIARYHSGKGPFFVSEFYPGWLDNWGLKHSVVPTQDFIKDYDRLLSEGISVSLYVFHGGTTFGFMNGANDDREHPILPQPTTYDYDAPLDESGHPTLKYFTIRETILKHLPPGTILPDPPPCSPLIEIPEFTLKKSVALEKCLTRVLESDTPRSMEDMDQGYGYVLYRTILDSDEGGTLKIDGLRDYAVVSVDRRKSVVLDRRLNQDSVFINSFPFVGAYGSWRHRLDILVENLGRINYGRKMTDNRKGITGSVTLNGKELKGWKIYPLPFNAFTGMRFTSPARPVAPLLRQGKFSLKETGDTFLDMRGWGKGSVWVNGHAIGRYWSIGPQQTLYVPGVWLKKGENQIVIFELLKGDQDAIKGITKPVLDQLSEQ